MPDPRPIRIAIDGPAASGKGTLARAVARALGYRYLDTGAMYRALALVASRQGLDMGDEARLAALARRLDLDFDWDGEAARVRVAGEDLSEAIRGSAVGAMASAVAVHPAVRAELVRRQQELARRGGVVVDGRDIGSVVLPDAELKVFLDASLEERARRRAEELRTRGQPVELEAVRRDLAARDAQDSGRATGPLTQAADAHRLDSSALSVDQVVARVLELARAAGA